MVIDLRNMINVCWRNLFVECETAILPAALNYIYIYIYICLMIISNEQFELGCEML
jgi:hypothetical protein